MADILEVIRNNGIKSDTSIQFPILKRMDFPSVTKYMRSFGKEDLDKFLNFQSRNVSPDYINDNTQDHYDVAYSLSFYSGNITAEFINYTEAYDIDINNKKASQYFHDIMRYLEDGTLLHNVRSTKIYNNIYSLISFLASSDKYDSNTRLSTKLAIEKSNINHTNRYIKPCNIAYTANDFKRYSIDIEDDIQDINGLYVTDTHMYYTDSIDISNEYHNKHYNILYAYLFTASMIHTLLTKIIRNNARNNARNIGIIKIADVYTKNMLTPIYHIENIRIKYLLNCVNTLTDICKLTLSLNSDALTQNAWLEHNSDILKIK